MSHLPFSIKANEITSAIHFSYLFGAYALLPDVPAFREPPPSHKKRAGTAFGGPGSRFQVYGLGAGPENEGTAVADNNEDEEKLCVERYIRDSHYDPLPLSKNLKYGAFRILRSIINPFSSRVKRDFLSLWSDSDTVIPEAGQGKCHPMNGSHGAKSAWNAG